MWENRAGGTQRLPRIIGIPKAKELMYTAQLLKGEEAFKIGLVNYVEEDYNAVNERAMKIAQKIAQNVFSSFFSS